MHRAITEIITSEAELREILGAPQGIPSKKAISILDKHCQQFIAKSPFVLIGTSDASGNLDISPKGDPAGFVQVLDEKTLAIPDRIGNNRADTFRNILQNDHVALLFMIPDKGETLRVSGRAKIVRDQWLREQMAHKNKVPHLAIVVTVEEAFIHCAKCIIRAQMWDSDSWQSTDDMASLAKMLRDHSQLNFDVEQLQENLEEEYKNELY